MFGLALATAVAAIALLGACVEGIETTDAELADLSAEDALYDDELAAPVSEDLEVVENLEVLDDANGSPDSEFEFEGSVDASCGYVVPPRCGARNCVAMCVTCLYDLCRAAGGSCNACKADMEACKDDCQAGWEECPPHDPFCDFN